MISYYRKQTPGQMVGKLSRLSSGINEYAPPVAITENHLSDVIDVQSYRDEVLIMDVEQTLSAGIFHNDTDLDGMVLEASSIQGVDEYALLVFNNANDTWHIRHAKVSALTVTNYTLTGYGLPTSGDMYQYNYSSCNFSTQAKRYVVFTCEYAKVLIYFDYLNSSVGKITLPFYPKKIVTHTSRIFCIDTDNNIWWCRAGDIYSWYGIEYDDDYLMASANMSLTPYTLTAQPDVCRPITATATTQATADTLGTLSVVGTGALGQTQSETIVPISNTRVQSVLTYATITSITSVGWSASSTADTIKFGVAPVSSGYVQLDSGYWTIEREKTLSNLCVLSDNLYIFAEDNIYVFKGYSYDTFTLSQAVANIGLKSNTIPRRWLTTISNLAYFYMNGDIYEFNGYDYPKLITHSIHINGQLSNGVMGGIETLNTNYALASDTDNLYVYDARTYLFDTNYYYLFDTNVRTWWKKSGFTKHNTVYTSTAFNVLYVTKYNTDSIVSFVSVNSAAGSFDMHTELGHKGLLNPYLVTKAYNSNPSEIGTLTNIILEVLGDSSTQTDIILYYSKSMEGNDFIEFKRYTNYIFTEDIEILDIPVPFSYIANAHHYRLKIEIDGYMEIYNIERRFRVRGRSR